MKHLPNIFKKPAKLLLLWDGFSMYAAIYRDAQLSSIFTCSASKLDAALAQLPAEHKKIRRCLLAAIDVLPALIDLPVDPLNEKPRKDMEAMVRWELEPSLAQQQAQWSIGAVLCARGSLSPSERYQVQLELELAGKSSTPARFGEVALALDLIDREELDFALKHQEALREFGHEISVGYHGYSLNTEHGQHGWLVAGLASHRLQHWLKTFKAQNLQLQALVPLNGLATGITPNYTANTSIEIEISHEYVLASLLIEGRVHGLRHESRGERNLAGGWLGDMLADWMSPDLSEIHLHWRCAQDALLITELAVRSGREPQSSNDIRAQQFAALAALADAKLSLERTPQLALRAPFEFNFKDPALRRWLILAVALALIIAWSIDAALTMHDAQKKLARYKSEQREQVALSNSSHQLQAETNRLNQQVKAVRASLAASLEVVNRGNSLEERSTLVPDLIRVMGRVIGDDVVLDVLRESSIQDSGSVGIHVEAWSPSDAAGQRFAGNVGSAIASFGFIVAQSQINAKAGRNGEPGYQISFWLIPNGADPGLEVPQ